MANASHHHVLTPTPRDVDRLGAKEAARQAALLRVPEQLNEAAGRVIADPSPGLPLPVRQAA